MHDIQQKLLRLAGTKKLGEMSYREIAKLVGETAPQKIKHHLLQLEDKGLIHFDRLSQSIAKTQSGPTSGNKNLLSIAILGTANCGPATIYADQNIEGYLKISGRLLSKKKDIFAIKAFGHSMNKANLNGQPIEDGDYVIVDPSYKTVKNGDYVLSIIDGSANIKRYFDDRANRRIILLSESSGSYPPIFIHYKDMDRYIVNGRIIQVIKKPKTTWSRLRKLVYQESN